MNSGLFLISCELKILNLESIIWLLDKKGKKLKLLSKPMVLFLQPFLIPLGRSVLASETGVVFSETKKSPLSISTGSS